MKQRKNIASPVLDVNNLPADTTEQMVRSSLADGSQSDPIRVHKVKMHMPVYQASSAASVQHKSLKQDIAAIQAYLPFVNDEGQSVYDESRHRGRVKYQFTSIDDLARAAEKTHQHGLAKQHDRQCGQVIRREAHVSGSVVLSQEVYALAANSIAAILQDAAARGVTLTINREGTRVRLTFLATFQLGGAPDLAAHVTAHNSRLIVRDAVAATIGDMATNIQEYMSRVRKSFVSAPFRGVRGASLCTQMAKPLLLSLCNEWRGRGHVHCNNRSKVIVMYASSPENLKQLQRELNDLAAEIKCSSQSISLDAVFPLVCRKRDSIVKECGLESIRLTRVLNIANVFGSTESIARFVEHVTKLREKLAKKKAADDGRACSICWCEFEVNDSVFRSPTCEHSMHHECALNLLRVEPAKTPVVCAMCGVAYPAEVVVTQATSDEASLRFLLEASMSTFLQRSEIKKKIVPCVQVGCQQLLVADNRAAAYCSLCETSYCLDCSSTMERACVSHQGMTCAQASAANTTEDLEPEMLRLRNHIQNKILTLRCPGCEAAFYDFTGCFSVTCETCKICFCGYCFKNCGADAHPHVLECPENPWPKSYFPIGIDYYVAFSASNVKRQTPQVKAALLAIENVTLRQMVFESIEPDLRSSNVVVSPGDVGL